MDNSMKKLSVKFLILIACILSPSLGVSQEKKVPFNVLSPVYWLKVEQEQDTVFLKDLIGGKVLDTAPFHLAKKLNQNISFPLRNTKGIALDFTWDMAQHFSIFVVYESSPSEKEQNIWFLNNHQSPIVLATNHRLADVSEGQYRSYPQKITQEKTKIHHYQHYKNIPKDSLQKGKYTLNLGGLSNKVPSSPFSGYIAEVLVYDRVLSNTEMQQVNSYLAIKYGVSLHQNHYKNYYNSLGENIWDYQKHKRFNRNITGIGKDTLGVLEQFSGINSNDEQVMSMKIRPKNSKEIPDNYFVFWSDDAQDLVFEQQAEGRPKSLSRTWSLDYLPDENVGLDWGFHIQNIQEERPKGEFYWLALDTSGQHLFTPATTRYIQLHKTSKHQDTLRLENFEQYLDSRMRHPVHYSIWRAPGMFAHLDIEQGKCREEELGKVHFNMVGGVAPYSIKVKSMDQNISPQSWKEPQNKGMKTLKLPSGRYVYEITDNRGHAYQQEFYLTHSDAPKLKLNAEYIIGKEPIILDMSAQLPRGDYSYQWYYHNDLVSQNSSFLLNQAGNYELRIQNAMGCHYSFRFRAYRVAKEKPVETDIVLYPNPSAGFFKFLSSFPKATSGVMSLYDLSGKLLYQQEFYNTSQYEYDGRIDAKGAYIIHLKTTLGEYSRKLIVH